MNRLFKVLTCFVSAIIIVLSLAFIVIEGRLVFSLDWIIYDSPFDGFIRYFLRLLIAIDAFVKSILDITYINKDSKIKEYLYQGDVSLLVMSVIILIFSTNYVGIVCISLTGLQFVIKTCHKLYLSKKEN